MRSALRLILTIGGIAAVLIALLHIALGPASIPGTMPVNATLDSEDRFYAVIFLGYGLALIHAARDVVARAGLIRILVGLFFLGGLARIIAWIQVGPPVAFFQVMTELELGLPVVVLWLQSQVSRLRAA